MALEGLLTGKTVKRFLRGTHRACPPCETVARVRPLLSACGITRVANVTGLDRLGIPVVMVVRPNARSLSVSQGKGVDLDAARASGIMEALELHFAEHPRLEVRVATLETIRSDAAAVDPHGLLMRRGATFANDSAIPWVCGRDLVTDCETWVPYERVHVDFTLPDAGGVEVFARDSNGLASGNSLAEAVAHALLEVIERDAAALEERRRSLGTWSPLVDVSGFDSVIDDLVDRCHVNGVTIHVREITSDLGIPAYEATLVDADALPLSRIGPMPGTGCHPDPTVGLSRALTEAAQSRLTWIAGSRDDLSSEYYSVAFRNNPAPEPGLTDFIREPAPRRCEPQPTFEADIEVMLQRLRACGVGQVIAVDLSPADRSLAVVRVVVPGLEGLPEHPDYTPGIRAMAITS